MSKPIKMLFTGFLLVALPLLFIELGGVPAFSVLMGQGEGFAYFLVYLLLMLMFVGVVFLLIGIGMLVFKRTQRRKDV